MARLIRQMPALVLSASRLIRASTCWDRVSIKPLRLTTRLPWSGGGRSCSGQGGDVAAFAVALVVAKDGIHQSFVQVAKLQRVAFAQPAVIFFHAFHVLGEVDLE